MNGTIGLRAKTGRAIAIVVAGGAFVWRGELRLVDPSAEIGPYHEVMELPWAEAQVAVKPLVAQIEAIAEAAVREVLDEMRAKGVAIKRAGVVGSPPRNIDRIGNPHIRAHAAEGMLFRRVLELAAKTNGLRCAGFAEDDIDKSTARTMGKIAGPPWRVDEQLAAAAALRVAR